MLVCHVDNGVHSSGIVPGRMDAILFGMESTGAQERDDGEHDDKDANKASPVSSGVTRRDFLRLGAAGAAAGLAGWRTSAWAAGSDAPEKKEVKIGFHSADRLRQCGDRVGNGL